MSGVFLYYPGRRQVLPKLRAFIEHVKYRGPMHRATELRGDSASATAQTALDCGV